MLNRKMWLCGYVAVIRSTGYYPTGLVSCEMRQETQWQQARTFISVTQRSSAYIVDKVEKKRKKW